MVIFESLVAAWMAFSLICLLAIGRILAEIRNHLNKKAAERSLGRVALS